MNITAVNPVRKDVALNHALSIRNLTIIVLDATINGGAF